MPTLATALALLLALAPALQAEPPGPRPGKPRAPVTITAQFGTGTAVVNLQFDAEAEKTVVSIWGLDGLTVTQATPLPRTSYRKGDTLALAVTFVAGSEAPTLAVSVGGLFHGLRQKSVQTFGPGQPAKLRAAAAARKVLTTSEGQRLIKAGPAAN